MRFFDKKENDVKAVDKVHQWLVDTAENVPESLGDTSIMRLSKQASAELDIPQGTTIRALYDLRDSGKFVRVKGNTRSGKYQVKPVAERPAQATVSSYSCTTQPKARKIVVDTPSDQKCAQKEPKVCVSKNGKTLNINITITIEA